MANLRSLPVSWNFSGLVNKRFLDLSHHLKPKARVHDFGVIECGYSVYIWWIQRNFGQRWSLEKNRLHYGNKAIIYVFNFLNFHMWFWGNNMVLRRFLKKKLKIVSRGLSVFGGKSMEKLDGCIYHIAGGEPISLGWENRAKLWVGLLTSMSFLWPPTSPQSVLRTFPSLSWGRQHLWSAELSLWRLKLHTDLKKRGLCLLPQPCLGFSLGFGVRLWALNWYFASLDLVLSFCLVNLPVD